MLAFSNDYYGMIFRATQSVELFCAYDLQTDNKRNGHSTKNLKSQYGEFQIDVPKEKQEWGSSFKPLIPALCLFLRHLYYCQKFPILFQRSGVGRAHKRQ